MVAEDVRKQVPDLAEAVDAGAVAPAADPVDLAAVAYLLRPTGWDELVTTAVETLAGDAGSTGRAATRQLDQLRRQLEAATEGLKEARGRHREQLATLKAENTDLRHKLGDARARARVRRDRRLGRRCGR